MYTHQWRHHANGKVLRRSGAGVRCITFPIGFGVNCLAGGERQPILAASSVLGRGREGTSDEARWVGGVGGDAGRDGGHHGGVGDGGLHAAVMEDAAEPAAGEDAGDADGRPREKRARDEHDAVPGSVRGNVQGDAGDDRGR